MLDKYKFSQILLREMFTGFLHDQDLKNRCLPNSSMIKI